MQIVIPMSGFGERFRRAGYAVPKPLIRVDDKTMVEHAVALFPGETDVTFICNEEHLADPDYRMREILTKACPTARIVGIAPHKLGPIHAVRQAEHHLDDDRPVVVNYCDFSQLWDWRAFKKFVAETACDGSIPSYRGFHPHALGSTFYAYQKLDPEERWLVDIQEKRPWTATPSNEFASSGTYYFRSASLMKKYFAKCVEENLDVNGEYYVSMAFRPMAYDGLKVNAYPVEHFMQWGTPEDLEEYQAWDRLFRRYHNGLPPRNDANVAGSVVIPMAGLGSRFAKEGYSTPKPLIKVGRETMIERAVADMSAGDRLVIVTRADLPGNAEVSKKLRSRFKNVNFVTLPGATEGQAISCLEGVRALSSEQRREPLTIAACDNGVIFDANRLKAAMASSDCLVWGYRGHAPARRKPGSYSWIVANASGEVDRIDVKKLAGDPKTTPIVIGAFTFKSAEIFAAAVEAMVKDDVRVNGEFYADSVPNVLLAEGLRVRLFEVDHYVSFGTPDELKTYDYWYRCFSRWPLHPLEPADD